MVGWSEPEVEGRGVVVNLEKGEVLGGRAKEWVRMRGEKEGGGGMGVSGEREGLGWCHDWQNEEKRNKRGPEEENLPDKDNRSMKSKQDEFLLGSVRHLEYSTLHHGPR